MNESVDALRTLARHSKELERAHHGIATARTEKLRIARQARDDAEANIRQAEGQQQSLVAEVRELASASGTSSSAPPTATPRQAEVRAALQRLETTWPTFDLLQASEAMEADERRALTAGRTIQWVWLGLTVLGSAALIAAPSILLHL